jgi:hypothetical protein
MCAVNLAVFSGVSSGHALWFGPGMLSQKHHPRKLRVLATTIEFVILSPARVHASSVANSNVDVLCNAYTFSTGTFGGFFGAGAGAVVKSIINRIHSIGYSLA